MRNVRALFLAIGVLIYCRSNAQCLELFNSLEARTVSSSLITEAKVISATTRWNEDHSLILTEYGLDVHKVLKGELGASVLMVVTYGGNIGDTGLVTSSYLPLQVGDYGIFFLNDFNNQIYAAQGQQSLIHYQQDMITAYDNNTTYTDIKKELYKPISRFSGQKIKVLKETAAAERNTNPSLGDPVLSITSFSPTTITPGTLDTLTIIGSGFGDTRCETCYLYFKNADAPSTSFPVPTNYYTYWSDEMVKVLVPGNGVGYTPGSGTFYITNEAGQQLVSTSAINMPYSVLNNYVGSTLNRVSLIGNNGNGGYTLTLDQNMASNPAAVEALKRAVQTWRCEAGVNFNISTSNSNATCAGKDNINSVSFSKTGCNFPTTPLAQTMIWYTCKYIQEVDIVFNSAYNFDYIKGSTPNSQYDFESVALHELGHAFGMGHIIGNGRVMHPTLQNGAEVTTLISTSEISGASDMIVFSRQNGCSQSVYKDISNNDCALLPPSAMFTVSTNSGCAPLTIQPINSCTGATSYSWDINNDGTVDYSSNSPQHTFQTAGQYAIKLTATNSFGSASYTLSNGITVTSAPTASISGSASSNVCEGSSKKLTSNVSNAQSLQWKKNGINIPGATGTTYNANQSGNYTLSATALNCPVAISSPVTLNSLARPVVSLELKSDTLYCTQGMTKYAWMLNGSFMEGESKSWVIARSAGDYTAIAENAGGCSDTSNIFAYRLTPVAENATDDIFSLFPNPATDRINIYMETLPGKNASISILNMMGANVHRQENILTGRGDNLHIPVAFLPSGMYVVKIESEDKAYTRKFIKN